MTKKDNLNAHDLSDMRRNFTQQMATDINDFASDPVTQFNTWFQVAEAAKILEPNAFVLSTANAEARPRSRTVLLKYYDHEGFVFFTNYGSEKAKHIAENAQVSALFPWLSLELQLIIDGTAEKISKKQSLAYFMKRPRDSQIGAWVSHQSQVIESRQLLIQKAKDIAASLTHRDVPLPDFWGGYRIRPTRVEFWQGQPNRLHNRIEYTLQANQSWQKRLLAP